MKQILDVNKLTLLELHVWDDFRMLAVVVCLRLSAFTNLKYLSMVDIQVETVEEKQIFELFLEQLKENKTLRGVSINKVFSKSQEYSDKLLETVATLKLTEIIVHAEKDCGVGN